jgi:polysaccharide pyruvyl transferase WcaK-like protein
MVQKFFWHVCIFILVLVLVIMKNIHLLNYGHEATPKCIVPMLMTMSQDCSVLFMANKKIRELITRVVRLPHPKP